MCLSTVQVRVPTGHAAHLDRHTAAQQNMIESAFKQQSSLVPISMVVDRGNLAAVLAAARES